MSYHFEVEGQCRPYDLTPFCSAHHIEAIDFAAEWLADVVYQCEPGESMSVTVHCRKGESDYGCNARHTLTHDALTEGDPR